MLIEYNRVMIRAVLFDYGGVLTEAGGKYSMTKTTVELFGIDIGQSNLDDLHDQLRLGLISTEKFFVELSKLHNHPRVLSEGELHAADRALFKRSQPVYDLAMKLRDDGIGTGILSNIYKMSANIIRAAGNYEDFDPVILSFDVHLAKPDPEIFELAVRKLGCQPNEVIFVDDQEKNQAPSQNIGMRFILATSPEQIVREISDIIKQVNGLVL